MDSKSFENFKNEIVLVLAGIFGNKITPLVNNYYDTPQELIQLATSMLTHYMGEENAKKLLGKVLSKYPPLSIGA